MLTVMRTLAAAASLSLVGCVAAVDTSSTTQQATVHNKLASNKLASNKLASNKLASNKLASNKLASNKLAVNMLGAGDLLSTEDGREVFSYIVGCALPDSVTLVANIPGAPDVAPGDFPFSCTAGVCEFPGALGLTPSWANTSLDGDGKRWISACMFARCNAHNTSEEISLHGENHALTVAPDEEALYTVEEGAFYGNMFTPGHTGIQWYACEGEGQASGEFGGLVDRDCTEPDPNNPGFTQCGFVYAGHCRNFTPQYPSPYACEDYETRPNHSTYYDSCFPQPILGTHHHHGWDWDDHDHAMDEEHEHGHEFEQAITTYVTP